MILIVGASGVLGREVARQLLAAGQPIRATARAPQAFAELEQLGAEVVAADLIDAASLARACRGVDAVLAAAHSLMGTGRYASDAVDGAGHRALVDAAKSAGARRFVYTSARGVSIDHPVDFFRTKAGVEQYLKQSGLDYSILRPSAFMEWHVHNLLGKSIVESGKTTLFGSGNNPTNFVAACDVARFAVAALTGETMSAKTIDIGGPDNVTKRQVVQMYEHFLGRAAKVRRVPVGAMRVMAPLVRPFQPVLGRLIAAAIWAETTDQTFDQRGMSLPGAAAWTHVKDFIRQRAAGDAPARPA